MPPTVFLSESFKSLISGKL